MHKLLTPLVLTTLLNAAYNDNKFEFGFKTSAYNYTERDPQDNILDTEQSDLFDIGGIYGNYEHEIEKYSKEDYDVHYYVNLYTSITYGDTEYIGSLLSPPGPYGSYKSTTENSFYELQANLKRVSYYNNSSTYILLGLGYKEWRRELSTTQIETYYYFFSQAVAGAQTAIYNDWSIGLDLTVQLAYNPKMEADFSGGTERLHETFLLGTVYTYKIAVPLTIPIINGFNFMTKMEYEFTSIGKSNTIITPGFTPCSTTGCYEPDSQQKNLHIYTGLQLLF